MSNEGASGKAITALIFGILGFFTCPLVGIVALFLGKSASADINAGKASPAGAGMAKAGIILGWIHIVLLVLGILVIVGMVVLGISLEGMETQGY